MSFNTNIDDILNEESSSDEDQPSFDQRGKGYNKNAENDKIRRILQQEQSQAKVAQKQLNQSNIDFDEIERELDSKYGRATKQDTHTYTKEELMNSSSEDEGLSSSNNGSPAGKQSDAPPQTHDTVRQSNISYTDKARTTVIGTAQDKGAQNDRQKALNDLIQADSDESESDDDDEDEVGKYDRVGSFRHSSKDLVAQNKDTGGKFQRMLDNESQPHRQSLTAKDSKLQTGQPRQISKDQMLRHDKQESIRNLGFDIDKALQDQGLFDLTSPRDATNNEALLIEKEDHSKIIQIIQNNEKNNEAIPEKMLQQANQLLSIDNSFYNVKNTIVAYEDYPIISQKLQQRDHSLYGVVQCVAMLKTFFFVGNSKGIIRVFNLKTQHEMMPLKDSSNLNQQRITTMDIDEEANILMNGFQNGGIALWDLEKYTLLKSIQDLHQSAVTNIKILEANNSGQVSLISCEDEGTIIWTLLQRRAFIGGYSVTQEVLFKERITGPSSIAPYKPSKMYPHAFCDESIPIAFGGIDNISIITLKPVSGLHSINKPKFSRTKCIPYMDWGFGLTPSHREKTVPMLAFAWDKIIQLIYVNQEGTALEVDGFFYSDKEIISLYFIGDSVLFALFENKDGRETKVLYTPKFYPGSYKQLEQADQAGNYDQFERVASVTDHAKLEKKNGEIQNLFFQVHNKSLNNFTNSVHRYKQNIVFLGSKSLQRARVHAWKEYIDLMKEKHDWLAVLKVALEIYNGDLKGFAKVADEKELREVQMKSYLKELLKTSIETVIYKFQQISLGSAISRLNTASGATSVGSDYRADEIAIKVAIEFCLNIGATNFLFSEIFVLFHQFNLRAKLIANLEPFLISGQFKKGVIPEDVLQEFLKYYEQKDGAHTNQRNLERIVQQIDLMQYSVGMRAGLEVFCEQHCMISALLHLQKSSSQDKKNGEADIISTMYKILKQLRKNEKKSQEKNASTPFSKADILILSIVDSSKKYEIEKSYCYIGYKLLWIMKMYLEGRQFPYGSSLTQEQWKRNTLHIAEYIVNKEFVTDMLEFDPYCFFDVIQKLFYGEPYWFIDRVKTQLESGQSLGPLALITKLKELIDSIGSDQMNDESTLGLTSDSPMMTSFYTFILNVHVDHQRYLAKMKQEALNKKNDQNVAQRLTGANSTNFNDWSTINELQIAPELIYKSIQKTIERIGGQIGLKGDQRQIKKEEILSNQVIIETEQRIIQAIQHFRKMSKEISQQLLEQITEIIDDKEELGLFFLRLRIFLLERQEDYLESFKLNLLDPVLKDNLFEWINKKLTLLDQPIDSDQKLNELKTAVAGQMKELIENDGEKTVQLIEKWFDDSYSDQLIVKELSQFPIQQFHFLTKYLHFNEVSIRITIKEAASQPEKQQQMQKYFSYLCLFVELMCKINKTNPELVDESLIEAYVKQEYYPVEECMEICQRYKQDRAIAVLQERDQDLAKAIETNMNYLKRSSLIKLCQEMIEIVEFHHTQQFLKTGKRRRGEDSRQKDSVESLIRNYGNRWDFEECYKYKYLDNFDQTVERAVDLAKRAYTKDGEGVFFTILINLGDWSQVIQARLKEEGKANKAEYEMLLKNRLDLKHEHLSALLEDFITKRKNAILMKHVPYNISPETLLAKLNLDLRSIRKVFDYRVKAIKSEKKLIKMANDLLEKEILQHFLLKESIEMQGYVLEGDPELRRMYMDETLISKDVCDICDRDIVSSTVGSASVCVFVGCGHTFHIHCVNIHFKESDIEVDIKKMKCPKCVIVNSQFSLEQLFEPARASRPSRGLRKSCAGINGFLKERDAEYQSGAEPEDQESGLPSTLDYSGYNNPQFDVVEESKSLMLIKFDQFDKLAAMGSLTSNDFTQL